ncbi:hypothetical protein ACQJBY_004547 [Aegilops geniculata]
MAEFWLMEHGLLSPERAKKAYDRKLKRQQQIKSGTPIKSSNSNTVSKHNYNNKPAETWKKPAPVVSSSSTARHNTDHTAAKAKRRVEYSSDDDDDKEFIVKLKRPNFNSNSNSTSRGG